MGEKRILLAEADPTVSEEFCQALGQEWKVTAVRSGSALLTEIKRSPYEVLVTELDLPEMDGAEVINKIRRKYPKTVRFILAEESSKDRVMKEMLGAHQFLAKPIDPTTLKDTIERAIALDAWIGSGTLRELISRVRSFPSLPSLYLEVLSALRSPSASPEEVGAIISKDMAMTTKLLQVLNSAYFGLPRTITDPAEAVGLLGFETVKSMVLAIKLLSQYDRIKPVYFSIDRLWRHSTSVAKLAKELVLFETRDRVTADQAFTCGLMHDIGKVVLAANFDEQYRGARSLSQKQQIPLWEVEKTIFGASHGEIGAYLLGLWGMPMNFVEVAALHHCPCSSSDVAFSALTAVHVANTFDYELNPDDEGLGVPQIDPDYLSRIRLSGRLKAWRIGILGLDTPLEPPAAPHSETVLANALEAPPAPLKAPAPVAPPPVTREAPVPEITSLRDAPQPPAAAKPIWPKPQLAFAGIATGLAALLFVAMGVALHHGKPQKLLNAKELATATPATLPRTERTAPRPEPVVAKPKPVPTAERHVTAFPPQAKQTPDPAPVPPKTVTSSPVSLSPKVPMARPVIPAEPAFPALTLQGIFYSTHHPAAILNGKTVWVDERVAGARVAEITPAYVVVEFHGRRKTLKLSNSLPH